MTSAEVCEALGISLRTLRRRVRDGELKPLPKAPGLKRAAALEFRKEDIEAIRNAANEY